MGKLNETLKFVFIFVNTLLFFISAGLLGVSIWALTSFWSELDQSFESISIILIVSSVVLIIFICLGCLGSANQTVRKGPRLLQGRKLLGIYQVCLILILVFQFYATIFSLNSVAALDEVQHTNSTDVEYVHIEKHLAPRFNDYYFDTLDTQSKHSWFWDWVDSNCPSSMSTDSCSALSYGSSCPDEVECEASEDDLDQVSCPYDVCREAAKDQIKAYLEPVGAYGMFVFLVELVMLILTCALTCYNPRDLVEDILTKSGTLTASTALRRITKTKDGKSTEKRKTRRLSAV